MANKQNNKTAYYKNILDNYNYCESGRINSPLGNGNEKYSNIIQDYIKNKKNSQFNKDIDFDLMEELNWIALWKTNRIIELKNTTNIKKKSLKIKKNESYYSTIENALGELLDSKKGVELPMASTILCFYNPNLCPILDVRADRAIFEKWNDLKELGFSIDDPHADKRIASEIKGLIGKKGKERKKLYYMIYLKRCENFINDNNSNAIKMDTIDKFLYQFDKYPNPDDKKTKNPIDKYKIGQWV